MPKHALKPTQAAAAAVLAAGGTQAEAAEHAGVGVRTVARWWAEDAGFRRFIDDTVSATMDRVAALLIEAAPAAVERLAAIAQEPASAHVVRASDRRQAARDLLDMAARYHTGRVIERRVARLEALQMGDTSAVDPEQAVAILEAEIARLERLDE